MSSVYFVAVTNNPSAIAARAVEIYGDDAVFKLSDDKFFVYSQDTSLDVSTKLGIRDGSLGSGIAFRITTYNGRASSNLWEWLGARLEK